jgi:hypothetical protein
MPIERAVSTLVTYRVIHSSGVLLVKDRTPEGALAQAKRMLSTFIHRVEVL